MDGTFSLVLFGYLAHEVAKPNSFDHLASNNALVTASFGRAVPNGVLNLFAPSLRLNIHPSLLPKFRGAAPIQRTIMSNETRTGVSILQMEDVSINGFDSGPVWDQCTVVSDPLLLFHLGAYSPSNKSPYRTSLQGPRTLI